MALMDSAQLFDLLTACEARLADATRSAAEALEAVRTARQELRNGLEVHDPAHADSRDVESERELLVRMVLAALDKPLSRSVDTEQNLQVLSYRPEDGSYCIGRRKVALTETERNIMDIFWQAMPETVSRDTILSALYHHSDKPSAGAIDVFISKLRQKLKLASNGRDFLESIRGKGWVLRPHLCGVSPAEPGSAPPVS